MSSKSTYVLYHANCPDGFGAALAAWLTLDDTAFYIPVQYGEPLPEIIDGSPVYIVDFSYDREMLLALKARCPALVVIDHHKTAKDALADLDFATFDMDKSGAVLTWEHFNPGVDVPLLLQYVQDRDLWRWKLQDSREVSAFLSIRPREFGVWEALLEAAEDGIPESWVYMGDAVLTSQKTQAASLCDHAFTVQVGGQTIPAVNSPLLQSEIGEELCKRNPDAPFAAAFFCLGLDTEVWSLRSRNGFDVSAVAKSYGGGGHPAAAGFKVPRGTIVAGT